MPELPHGEAGPSPSTKGWSSETRGASSRPSACLRIPRDDERWIQLRDQNVFMLTHRKTTVSLDSGTLNSGRQEGLSMLASAPFIVENHMTICTEVVPQGI